MVANASTWLHKTGLVQQARSTLLSDPRAASHGFIRWSRSDTRPESRTIRYAVICPSRIQSLCRAIRAAGTGGGSAQHWVFYRRKPSFVLFSGPGIFLFFFFSFFFSLFGPTLFPVCRTLAFRRRGRQRKRAKKLPHPSVRVVLLRLWPVVGSRRRRGKRRCLKTACLSSFPCPLRGGEPSFTMLLTSRRQDALSRHKVLGMPLTSAALLGSSAVDQPGSFGYYGSSFFAAVLPLALSCGPRRKMPTILHRHRVRFSSDATFVGLEFFWTLFFSCGFLPGFL